MFVVIVMLFVVRKCMLIYHTLLIDDELNSGECINSINIKVYPSSYANWNT